METQKTTTLSQLVNGVKREELRKSKLLAPFGWLQHFPAAPRRALHSSPRNPCTGSKPTRAAKKRKLSVPEAPKYIKVRKVFDLSRLHLVLFGLSQLILIYSLVQSKWTRAVCLLKITCF